MKKPICVRHRTYTQYFLVLNSHVVTLGTGIQMADMYVYHFVPFPEVGFPSTLSTRPATLSVIKGIGDPIMESQLVVDSSELDAEGFLTAAMSFCSSQITALTAKIRSLELRAASRDDRARSTRAVLSDKDVYMLTLESRHLRAEARLLIISRAKLLAEEAGHISATLASTAVHT
jgi:hypothetical protein